MSLDGSATLLGAGAKLGPYRIVRPLGEGGMGAVYEAVHTRLNKRVALKTLHRSLATSAEATERFVREGKAAARLRHAHAVDVADVAIEDGTAYLVMEFLEGEDLSRLIARSAPLAADQLVEIMLPVCAAIAAAHDEGIVHRDLKPENIFLARPKQGGLHPKVLDFGISKVAENDGRELTNASSVLGSPYYMSPEHAQGARFVNALSDEYSLGVILYEALTGRRPLQKENLFLQLDAILEEMPPAPREIRPEIPPALEQVVLRAMDKDPARRFPSVLDLGRALMPFGSDRVRAVWGPTFGDAPAAASPAPIPPAPPASAAPAIPPTIEAVLPDTIRADTDAPADPLGSTTLGASITRVVRAPPSPRETPRWVVLGAIAAVLTGGVALAWRVTATTQPNTSARPPSIGAQARAYRATVTVSPSNATITVDDAPAGTGSMDSEFAANGATHSLHVSAPGYEPFTVSFRDAPPPPRVELRPVAQTGAAIAAPTAAARVNAPATPDAPGPIERVPTPTTNVAATHPNESAHVTRRHPAARHPGSRPGDETQTRRPANGSRIVY
jgi:serine/threonine-protein kinase